MIHYLFFSGLVQKDAKITYNLFAQSAPWYLCCVRLVCWWLLILLSITNHA